MVDNSEDLETLVDLYCCDWIAECKSTLSQLLWKGTNESTSTRCSTKDIMIISLSLKRLMHSLLPVVIFKVKGSCITPRGVYTTLRPGHP